VALTRRVDGVVGVDTHLGYVRDDTRLPPADFPVIGATRLPKEHF
jgi:hypothetical protein